MSYFRELEKNFPVEQISIIDVGAGPFTTIGTYLGDLRLNLTPVDPLAHYYDRLLKKFALTPPAPTIFAEAEKLTSLFAPASFVWVNARNSIDHAASPVDAIREMISLVKPGGLMTLRHESNEAINEGYSGFHQWNLFQEGGIFFRMRTGPERSGEHQQDGSERLGCSRFRRTGQRTKHGCF